MKFTVEIRDYECGTEDGDVHASEVEEAVDTMLNDRGDSGSVIVEVAS